MPLQRMRSRLIAVVVIVLAVAFSVTNLVSYQFSYSALKEGVVDRELPLTGDTIYSAIQADLMRPIFVSSQMAHDTFLRDWVLGGELGSDQVRRFLDEIRQKYGFFTAFFISDKSRRYYHFSGVDKIVSEDDPRDAWFFRARAMAADYEINVDPNQQQGDRVTIFINHKIRDYNGQVIGITGVGMDFGAVAGVIERYRNEFGRNVFFVERTGRITLHSDPEVAYRRNLDAMPGIGAIAGEVAASDRGAFEYQARGETVLLTTRYIPELDWVLVVEQRESDATEGAGGALMTNIMIGLTAIAVTGLVLAWAISRFQRRLEEMATIDPLTGLHNRQIFDITLNQAIERARRTKASLSLILIDVDSFKATNDRYGHLTGDNVLVRLAELLRHSVRKVDTVARWGGEEFAVLMENCGAAEALRAADVLRQRVMTELRLADVPELRMTASFGVAELKGGEDVNALLGRADKALYRAKDLGRNQVVGEEKAVMAAEA